MKKVITYIMTLVLVSAVLSGCGGSSSSKAEYATESVAASDSYYDYDYATDDVYAEEAPAMVMDEEEVEYDNGNTAGNDEILSKNRKIIKTVNISAETEEFDALIENVTRKVEALGGYLANTDISGRSISASKSGSFRHANLTVRIPAKNLDAFLNNVEEISNITYRNESAEDVTLSYADTKARIDSLRTEQKRLNELIETADSVDTLIILEQRLTEVRYEIESYESRLRTMEDQIDYSTIYLSISEVEKYTPDPVVEVPIGQRIAEGFSENFKDVCEGIVDFFVELIIGLPYIFAFLLIIAFFALIIFLIVKFIIFLVKKSEAKRIKKMTGNAAIDASAAKKKSAGYENLKPVVMPDEKKKDE